MARNVIHEAVAVLNRPVEIRFRTEFTFQVPSLGYDGTMSCQLASSLADTDNCDKACFDLNFDFSLKKSDIKVPSVLFFIRAGDTIKVHFFVSLKRYPS